MEPIKRVFLIVLDSVGIGEMPDAAAYGDAGSHTLRSCWRSGQLRLPVLQGLGLYNIEGIGCGEAVAAPQGGFARLAEASSGKDTTVGHWEIAGVVSQQPLPTFPEGFPAGFLSAFEAKVGRKTLCNKPYSGTDVIRDFGRQQVETGALIVYTSADSVFQIAAHESVVPLEELYRCCEAAREMLAGPALGVGRVIARPFTGEWPFTRTPNRHDYSLPPPGPTFLDALSAAGLETRGVGKIFDIFAGRGLSSSVKIKSNDDGMAKTLAIAREAFTGLCFVNLVDFDMVYGHRNNIEGYTEALNRADAQLGELLAQLNHDDVLMVCADHGCDPGTPSTDHSREYIPWVVAGARVRPGANLGTLQGFSSIGRTAAGMLGVSTALPGEDFTQTLLTPWVTTE